MKKLISITLTIFLLIVAMPISAYAESVVIVSDEAPRYAAAADYSSEAYKEAEERILAGFENLSEEVSLSDLALPKDTFSDFYFTVRENNPQYFYINGHITFAVSPSAQTVVEVYPEYLFTGDELTDMKAKFAAEAEKALKCVDDSMTDIEKALALHDYLINTAEYDTSVYDAPETTSDLSYTAYGVLVNKIGVCQSYSFAYKYLLDIRCGIETQYAPSDEMGHVWNKILIDGEYYHVDVTWDDPVSDRLGNVGHTNFLKSDSAFTSHYGYDTESYPCTDTTYDEGTIWSDVKSGMWWYEGDFYYISSAKAFSKYNFATDSVSIIKSIPDTWKVFGTNSYYVGTYSSLSLVDGVFYYNLTDSIWSINPDGSEATEKFTIDTSEKYIYGSAYRDGGIYYTYKNEPSATEDIRLAFEIKDESDEPEVEETPDFDLYASSVSLPSVIEEGVGYTVSAVLRNLGTEDTPVGTMVAFYIDGRLLCTETLDRTVAVGRSVTVSASVDAKSSFGSHSVKIFIGHSKYTDESDTTNNTKKSRFLIN